MVMGICSRSVHISLLSIFVKALSFMISWDWIGVHGLGVFFGMVGCLRLPVPVELLLGQIRLVILLKLVWRELWALALTVFVGNVLLLIVFLLIWLPLTFLVVVVVY